MLQHEAAGTGVSTITACELAYGTGRSGPTRNPAALQQVLEPLTVADFVRAAAAVCAQVRAHLEAAGTPIGPLDTQLAAHALSLGVALVRNITREFDRVSELKVPGTRESP